MKGDLWGLFLLTDAEGRSFEGLLKSHELLDCAPNPCPLHAPSAHHMRAWRLHWRADRLLMERMCECGIGHPDPDHLSYIERTRGTEAREAEGVHGCCGCCRPTEEGSDE